MKLSLIVAKDQNHLIGRDNTLPWSLPEDLKHFKRTTSGHTVIMGRKTYESLKGPLPNRENIILTRNKDYFVEGCKVIHTVEELFTYLEGREEEIFVMGGKELYHLLFPYISTCYITEIEHSFEGDTHLILDLTEFKEVSRKKGIKDGKNPYDYDFVIYNK